MPTKQSTFNTVCEHLMSQGRQSRHAVFGCAYRGEDGLRCAIGALLPDEAYNFELEGMSAQIGTVAEILNRLEHDLSLCRDLQLIHDRVPSAQWPKAFEKVAARHGLSLPDCVNNTQNLREIDVDPNDSAAMSSPIPMETVTEMPSLPNVSQAINSAEEAQRALEQLSRVSHYDHPLPIELEGSDIEEDE